MITPRQHLVGRLVAIHKMQGPVQDGCLAVQGPIASLSTCGSAARTTARSGRSVKVCASASRRISCEQQVLGRSSLPLTACPPIQYHECASNDTRRGCGNKYPQLSQLSLLLLSLRHVGLQKRSSPKLRDQRPAAASLTVLLLFAS